MPGSPGYIIVKEGPGLECVRRLREISNIGAKYSRRARLGGHARLGGRATRMSSESRACACILNVCLSIAEIGDHSQKLVEHVAP